MICDESYVPNGHILLVINLGFGVLDILIDKPLLDLRRVAERRTFKARMMLMVDLAFILLSKTRSPTRKRPGNRRMEFGFVQFCPHRRTIHSRLLVVVQSPSSCRLYLELLHWPKRLVCWWASISLPDSIEQSASECNGKRR